MEAVWVLHGGGTNRRAGAVVAVGRVGVDGVQKHVLAWGFGFRECHRWSVVWGYGFGRIDEFGDGRGRRWNDPGR